MSARITLGMADGTIRPASVILDLDDGSVLVHFDDTPPGYSDLVTVAQRDGRAIAKHGAVLGESAAMMGLPRTIAHRPPVLSVE